MTSSKDLSDVGKASVFRNDFDSKNNIKFFEYLCMSSWFNPFIPVAAKTATSQVDLQVWKG